LEEPLQLLSNLAREYQQKYNQLASALRDSDPDLTPRQLKVRAELATDRFRAAQMDILSKMSIGAADAQMEGYEALVTLFRSFDEMRIIFQLLLEDFSGKAESRQ
jgi:hypothetical protein